MEYLIMMVKKTSEFISYYLSANGGIFFVIIVACFLMFMARKKTPRDFSFKVRTSLTSIVGYSRLLQEGKLGTLTAEQKKYIDEILAGSEIVKNEIANIEHENISVPHKTMSFNLRAGLMQIIGYSHLLSQTEPEISMQQKECLDEVQKAAHHILQIMAH